MLDTYTPINVPTKFNFLYLTVSEIQPGQTFPEHIDLTALKGKNSPQQIVHSINIVT